MRVFNLVSIDLLDFFRAGRFGSVRIGQTKEFILHDFPDPDDWGPTGRATGVGDARIWRYGNIELHFDGDELCMIFSDHLDELDGGPSLALDRWILDGVRPSLSAVFEALSRERIDFAKSTGGYQDGVADVTLTLSSGVVLRFELADEGHASTDVLPRQGVDPNSMRLSSFALRARPAG